MILSHINTPRMRIHPIHLLIGFVANDFSDVCPFSTELRSERPPDVSLNACAVFEFSPGPHLEFPLSVKLGFLLVNSFSVWVERLELVVRFLRTVCILK